MSASVILLLLRLLSALLLLGFLGMIAWLIYRDLQMTTTALTQQGQVRAALCVIANEGETPAVGTLFPLQPVTSIGRNGRNAIVLADSYASGEHALITWRGGQWWLEDLGSRNGTLLNDVLLEETAVITTGDIITIGETSLKIEF